MPVLLFVFICAHISVYYNYIYICEVVKTKSIDENRKVRKSNPLIVEKKLAFQLM